MEHKLEDNTSQNGDDLLIGIDQTQSLDEQKYFTEYYKYRGFNKSRLPAVYRHL